MKERIEWLDVSKGILILLVVLGHISFDNSSIKNGEQIESTDIIENAWLYVRCWIYSFHIPAFFIINGIFKNKKNLELQDFSYISLIKKQKKIIYYYIVFSFIFFIRFVFQMILGINSANDIFFFLYNTFTMVGMAALWFLPTFFFSQILFCYFVRANMITKVVLCLILVFTYLIASNYNVHNITESWHIGMKFVGVTSKAIIAASFVLLGYYLDKLNFWESKLLIFGFLSFLCIVNNLSDLNKLIFNNPVLYNLFAIFGTMLVVIISKEIVKLGGSLFCFFKTWGEGSLFIMCTHTILLIIYTSEIISLKITNNLAFLIIVSFIISILLETLLYLSYRKIENYIRIHKYTFER